MKRIALLSFLLLSACNEANTPEPYWACLKTGEPYSCKGGYCYPCVEHGIACPKPTVLIQKDEKLICRMPEVPMQ